MFAGASSTTSTVFFSSASLPKVRPATLLARPIVDNVAVEICLSGVECFKRAAGNTSTKSKPQWRSSDPQSPPVMAVPTIYFSSAIIPSHARRAYLSGLSILWSTSLICHCAHTIRQTLSLVPIFSRMSRMIRRNVAVHTELVRYLSVGLSSGERPQYECLFAGQRWVQPES
jgi:hypothetical protein